MKLRAQLDQTKALRRRQANSAASSSTKSTRTKSPPLPVLHRKYFGERGETNAWRQAKFVFSQNAPVKGSCSLHDLPMLIEHSQRACIRSKSDTCTTPHTSTGLG